MDLPSSSFSPFGTPSVSSSAAAPGATAGSTAADATTATAAAAGTGLQLFGEDGLDFFDLLDVINPLQHIPIISTIYRMATGDEIASLPRLMGGVLFGGLPGLAAASVNVALDHATGKDLGEHVVTAFLGDENGDITPSVMVAELPAADAPWYMSGVVTYSREGEGQADPIFTADAGTIASDARGSSSVTLASRSRAQIPWYVAGKTGLSTGATAPVVVAKAEITPAAISSTARTPSPAAAATAQPHAGLGSAPVDAVEVMNLPPTPVLPPPASTTPVSAAPPPAVPAPGTSKRSEATPTPLPAQNQVQNQVRTSAQSPTKTQTAPLAGAPGQSGRSVAINNNLDTFLKAFAGNGGNSSAALTATRAQAAPAPQTIPTRNAAVMPQGVNPAVAAAQANGGGVVTAPPAGGVSNILFRPPSPDQLPPSLNPMGAHKGLVHTPPANYAKAMMAGLDKYQAAVDRGDVGPSRIYISR